MHEISYAIIGLNLKLWKTWHQCVSYEVHSDVKQVEI